MAVLLGAIALLLTLCDAYVVLSVLGGTSWLVKGWMLVPAVVLWGLVLWMVFTGDTRQMILNGVMWIVVCVVFPTLVFTALSLVGKCTGLIWSPLNSAFMWVGVCVAAVWIVIALYGSVFGWRRLEVKNTDIVLADLPKEFDGYRIAQISDFHIGVYGAASGAVERIVEKLNSLNPDLIVFTGDLVSLSPDELTPFMDVFGRLKAPDGVVSILGNHDYCIYGGNAGRESLDRALARVVKAEADLGWRLLRNESVQITRGGDSIAIVGVENAGSGQFPDKSDLRKALRGVPDEECKILLSHDPSHWRREVLPDTDVALMLAGHTHAMQFRLGGFSPSKWSYPEWGGLYREGEQQLYVSTGVGGNVAFRFGVYPTIDLITLRCESQ